MADVQAALEPLRAEIVKATAAKANPVADPIWTTAQLAQDCLEIPGPDGRACQLLYNVAKIQQTPAQPPVSEPLPARLIDWIILGLSALSVALLLTILFFGWRSLQPAEPEPRGPAKRDETAESDDEEDDEDDEDEEDAPDEVVAEAGKAEPEAIVPVAQLHAPEPIINHAPSIAGPGIEDRTDGSDDEIEEDETTAMLRNILQRVGPVMNIRKNKYSALLTESETYVSEAGLEELPAPVRRAYALVRALHNSLEYELEPSADQRNALNEALRAIDTDYSLFWDVGLSTSDRHWYIKIKEKTGNGKPWLKRVAYPGLKCNGKPVVRADIEVDFGPKPGA